MSYLWVCLYLKVVITEVTLHPELEDGCGVVLADCGLLSIVAHTHAHMGTTPSTPDVVRQLEPKATMSYVPYCYLHQIVMGM